MRFKALLAAVGAFLYERVWISKKSTILGLLVYAAGEVLIYFQGPTANPYARLIAGLIAAPFLAWKDKASAAGTIKLTIVLLFFGSNAAFAQTPAARAARANAIVEGEPVAVPPEEPLPPSTRFGGCTRSGKICFGPSLALAVSAINLTKKSVEGSFKPGLGFGMTVNPGRWSSYGVDFYLTLDPGPTQTASGALMIKFLNGYARAGISKGFIGDTSLRIPIAVGVDL